MPESLYHAILLFGPPGVGKGPQGKALGQLPGLFHVSSGDCFRELDENSEEGRRTQAIISRGELVPDALTMSVWLAAMHDFALTQKFRPDRDVVILDGIPRNIAQAEALREHVDLLQVVCLDAADRQVMVSRIQDRAHQQNRPDDADESVILKRFDIYQQQSAPVLDFYPPELFSRINALQSPAEVLRDILQQLIPVLQGAGRQTLAE